MGGGGKSYLPGYSHFSLSLSEARQDRHMGVREVDRPSTCMAMYSACLGVPDTLAQTCLSKKQKAVVNNLTHTNLHYNSSAS